MTKLIALLILLFPVKLFANTPDSTVIEPRYDIISELKEYGPNGGEVNLHGDRSIDNLLQWHIHMNEKKKTFTGYRIQIYSVNSYGCNIDKLKEMRDKFEETFQDIPAYLKYFDPDFKIRAGNFHSRLESIPALYRIRKVYPASYPVKTEISIEELKRIPMQDILQKENTQAEEGALRGDFSVD